MQVLSVLRHSRKRNDPAGSDFDRILIPVNGGEADAGAIELACTLAGYKSKKTIIAVNVIPVERCLPLDAEVDSAVGRAEGIMSVVEKQVEKLGHTALTDILQARNIGSAIIQASIEHCVDLILINLTYKQMGEHCLGKLAHYVLKNAPCRVILNYEADVTQS